MISYTLASNRVDRRQQPGMKIRYRRKTRSPQAVNRGHGMLHIARPFRGVFDFRFRAGQPANRRAEIVDGDFLAVGHVENTRGLGLRGEIGVGGGDVLHKDKIPRLLAVAVYRDRQVLDRTVNEDGHGSGILALGILARAKDFEVTQAGGRQPPFVREQLAEMDP